MVCDTGKFEVVPRLGNKRGGAGDNGRYELTLAEAVD